MKIFNTKTLLVTGILFSGIQLFSQKINPITQQRKQDNLSGVKGKELVQKFNSTLITEANPSQAQSLSDGRDVRVFPSSHVQAEVIISVNEANPMNLVASTNTLLGSFKYNQGFYYSFDGGQTWDGSDKLQKIDGSLIYGDPSLAFAANGKAFMTSIDANGGYWFQKSSDGGKSWSSGMQGSTTPSFDKEMIAADNTKSSPYKNNFYCSWTNFSSGNGAVDFNRSTDNGATFSTPVTLRSGAVGFGQGTNVQTGPNGEVYVCWADHATVSSPYAADHCGFAKSTNGGVTFTPATNIFPYTGIRVDGSSNQFNKTRVNDFPAMAVDKSGGANNGRIYIIYASKFKDTGKAVINVRYSNNGGKLWSKAKIISIDGGRQNWFPWIAVDDSTGDVWATYYSFDSPSGYSTNTYVAHSTDGGATWKNQKVSDVPHITAPIDNTNFATGYAGDYIGIAAWGGKAYPIWMDDRNGTWQLYVSAVTYHAPSFAKSANGSLIESNEKLTVEPNPFSSAIHVQLGNDKITLVQLFNQSGLLLKQWKNIYSNNFDVSDLSKGLYMIKVTTETNKIYSKTIIKE